MLSQWYEGNLLALNQSLEKLTLLYPDGELNLVRLEKASPAEVTIILSITGVMHCWLEK